MAQTLKFGNGTWATKKGSTLAFNDEDGNYKPLPFTTTRSTSATRVNKQGLIEVVTNDRPRIDYTDSAKGVLLLEPQSTNLITYSEAFDNAYWTKSGSSVTSGFISPDGNNNAFKLVEGTNTGTHYLKSSTISGGAITPHSISIIAKPNGRGWINLRDNNTGSTGVWFDITNGVVGTEEGTASGSIESLANGFYRCKNTYTNASANRIPLLALAEADNDNSYTGDGTSGVYIYGAQLELGSYPTSYIPTQGSAVTRLADTATDSGNSEVFNDSEGVLFADIAAFKGDNTDRQIGISNGSNSNRIGFQLSSNGTQIQFYVVSGGSDTVNSTKTINTITDGTKISFSYKVNNFKVYVNGFLIVTDTSGAVPIGLNKLAFDRGTGGDVFYGKTKEIGYYNTILTDLELETLTSYKSWTSMVNELNLNIIYNG